MLMFRNDDLLGELTLKDVIPKDLNYVSDLSRKATNVRPIALPDKYITLKFESVDTAELQDVEITFNGDRAFYKVGEGEFNHYQIPNDKKLWESQFMIINHNG